MVISGVGIKLAADDTVITAPLPLQYTDYRMMIMLIHNNSSSTTAIYRMMTILIHNNGSSTTTIYRMMIILIHNTSLLAY